MTRTKKEHIKALKVHLTQGGATKLGDLHRAVDYAITQGMPFAPEQVEPVVGELLTEATRLVDGMIVAANEEAARYEARPDRWYVTGVPRGHQTSSILDAEWRIVFVPGEPETEQKHETALDHTPAGVRAHCLTCGWRSGLYPFADDARKVAAGHVAVQS